MKKSWKVFWVLCISLGILGIALCISGMLFGATAESIREAFGIHRFAEGHMEENFGNYHGTESADSTSSYGTGYLEDSGSAQHFSQIRELKMDVTCLEVEISQGSGSEILVDTSDVEDELRADLMLTQKDEKLEIELKNRSKWEKLVNNNWDDFKGRMFIQIPADLQFEEASLKVGAGVLKAEVLHADELDIEVGAGQVYLDSFSANELDLECGAGEADIWGEALKETKIECGIGKVSYTAAGSQEDYDYEVSCGIGTVTVGNDSYGGLGGERKIHNGGSKKMEIECGIGMVEVVFEGRNES